MTDDLKISLQWAFGAIVLLLNAAFAGVMYLAYHYPHKAGIIALAFAAMIFVPYAVGNVLWRIL